MICRITVAAANSEEGQPRTEEGPAPGPALPPRSQSAKLEAAGPPPSQLPVPCGARAAAGPPAGFCQEAQRRREPEVRRRESESRVSGSARPGRPGPRPSHSSRSGQAEQSRVHHVIT